MNSVKKSDTATNRKPAPIKHKGGRPKGIRTDIIPSWQQAYMFMLWCENQNLEYVARQSGVASRTVTRYKELHQWEQKRLMIIEDIKLQTGETDNKAAQRHDLQQVRILKNQAFDATLKHGYKAGKDAANAYQAFVKLEQEMLGNRPQSTINLIVLAAEQFQRLRDKRDPKQIDAEITTVKDSDGDDQK